MIGRVIWAALCLHSVLSYKIYQAKIPNGDKVPFPCKAGKTWAGVGHLNPEGTGFRNQFGLDFMEAGKMWTRELCMKDSDGDGRSNGEELGDKNCIWNSMTAPSAEALSHPGICEPYDDIKCSGKAFPSGSKYSTQKEWLDDVCKSDAFNCPALNETGMRQMALRIPKGTPIPPRETTYQCMIYDLAAQGMPVNKSFHMVAVTPIIDNKEFLHHIVLAKCKDGTKATPTSYACGMVAHEDCQEYIHVWTVGLAGECLLPECGIKLGLDGITVVAMQLHWNNPFMYADRSDSSGLNIYYTSNMRRYDAGVIMIGNSQFLLPPKKVEINVKSSCSSSCTNMIFKGNVQIISAWNHMHYAGRQMSIEVKRNGSSIKYLTNDKAYSYDSPVVYPYTTPYQLQPGDALEGNCVFNTMNRNKTTFFGEATNDEMCFAFLTYYPRQNITVPFCLDNMGVSFCDPQSFGGCSQFNMYENMINTTTVYRQVADMCRPFAPCLEECRDTIVDIMKTDKCMQGNVWALLEESLAAKEQGMKFLSYLASCKVEVYLALNPPDVPTKETTPSGDGSLATVSVASLSVMLVVMVTTLLFNE